MQITTYYTPYIALLAILLFLTAAACNKDDDTSPADQLPPITTEGKGTFACLINGEVWKWKGRNPWNGFPNLDVYYEEIISGLQIQATKDIENSNQTLRQTFTIASFVDSLGNFPILFNNRIYSDYTQQNDCIAYRLDTLQESILEIIELDKENKIVSGTFEFTAINDCDTLRITEGRFDDFYRE